MSALKKPKSAESNISQESPDFVQEIYPLQKRASFLNKLLLRPQSTFIYRAQTLPKLLRIKNYLVDRKAD